jgi:hypothetical protein
MKKSNGGFSNKLRKLFLNIDQFGRKVELNVKGETSINSIFGAIISLIIYLFILGYGLFRF